MKIGIIGAGNWGHRVISEYLDLKEEKIIDEIIVCEKKDEILKLYPKFKTYNNYKQLLTKKNVDAVHICIPNTSHYVVAKTAMENGIHALVEKPLTQNSVDAYKLVEIASENDVILEVGHIYRFANVVRKIREIFAEDYFGDIQYLTFKWTNMFKLAQESAFKNVDIIWDLMPHILDMVDFITNKAPIGVTISRNKRQISFLNLDYDDFFANVELSWLTHERKRELRIIGSDRSAKIDCVKQTIHIHEKEKELDIKIEANNTIREEALNFISSIESGKMLYNSHIVGAKNVDIIEKMLGGGKKLSLI